MFWRAFKEKEPTLSFTFQDEVLRTPAGLGAYQAHFSKLIGGTRPGIVWLSYEGLTTRLSPQLVPRHAPDTESDPVYGHLHCVTDAPHEKAQMELLAKLVNDGQFGGVLREFVNKETA